ncbi:MAG TPA: hypothetical protein VJH04_03745 [archaeon]|nr:hypothetical protein [archaeon]
MSYNAAFFAVHEAYFLVLKEEKGEDFALDVMRRVMERSLGKAYTTIGFTKGSTNTFVKVVGKRDKSVGLRVEFPEVSEDRMVYRFHTDPFPNLRGQVDPRRLDDTYMKFKVEFLLGKEWHYRTTKHLWNGDEFTEHVIELK